jgi:hypothetical protein
MKTTMTTEKLPIGGAPECATSGRCSKCETNECNYGPASSSCGHLPESHCPRCGKASPYLNVGRDHWCRCDDCLVRWNVGANLFSSWHGETEEQWRANEAAIGGHADVSGEPHRTCCDNPEPATEVSDDDLLF